MESSKPATVSPARRVAGYAANILATGLVLLAALVFGSQTIAWWRADQRPVAATDHVTAVIGSDISLSDSWLQFGDATLAIQRTTLNGDEKAVFNQLRARCRPAADVQPLFCQKAKNGEQHLIQRLADKEPIERKSGQWKMYQLTEGLPMVVVISELKPNPSLTQVAAFDSRVISLGIAFPRTGDENNQHPEWSLVIGSQAKQPVVTSNIPTPEPPPRSQRLVTVHDGSGHQLCSWEGPGTVNDWRDSFDRWHLSKGWTAQSVWNQLAGTWHRRYEQELSKTFADVQITASCDGVINSFWSCSEKGDDKFTTRERSLMPHWEPHASKNK